MSIKVVTVPRGRRGLWIDLVLVGQAPGVPEGSIAKVFLNDEYGRTPTAARHGLAIALAAAATTYLESLT